MASEQVGNFALNEVAEIYCGWPNASAVKLQFDKRQPRTKVQDMRKEMARKGTYKS